jgi:F0F1-type ATP synthase assembly protein I
MQPTSDQSTESQSQNNRNQYAFNLTLAAVAGQVGCLTLVIILAALFGGLWLDSRFDSEPVFTVVLMIASVPFTIVAMLWVVKKATSRMQPAPKNDARKFREETNGGKNS